MAEPVITVLTVNYNTSDFIELMLYSLERLTVRPYRVIICDNGSKQADILKLVGIVQKNKCVELVFRQQGEIGSRAHGEALDILTDLADTEYTVIMDSDCVFLLKGWDERLISQLDDEVKIVGATSPVNRAGERQGGGNFPLPFAVLFETAVYKGLGIRCVPADKIRGGDTCWEWQKKFTAGGFTGKTFISKSTRDYKQGPFGDLIGVEEYYTEDGKLVASHFGRGSSLGEAKYFKRLKAPIVSRYIKRFYGKTEKHRWMSKCYRLIDNQCG